MNENENENERKELVVETSLDKSSEKKAKVIKLPFVVGGKRISATKENHVVLDSSPTHNVHLPKFDSGLADQLLDIDRNVLVDVPLAHITNFLNRVGRNWRSSESSRRQIFISQLQSVLGYSFEAAEIEADWIAAILTSHSRLQDLVELELGSRHIVDEWVRTEEAMTRAYPVGLVAHILPGNVPSSSVMSIVRALLTKNVSMAKVASGDPVTAISLALSFLEIDPNHPVSRALNVVYWPTGDSEGAKAVNGANAVCAWGADSAIAWASANRDRYASFTPYGPKSSFGLVGNGADLEGAALALAHDVAINEQEACFSVQRVFVEQAIAERFLPFLEEAMIRYEKLIPPKVFSVDTASRMNALRLDLVFAGGEQTQVGERSAILVLPAGTTGEQPLGRTLMVHPVDDLAEAIAYVKPTTQTVAAAPWHLLANYREEIARAGASRLVELGLSNFFRVGGTHDGFRPLQNLVRYAAVEDPSHVFSKGMTRSFNQTELIENREFQEMVF